MGTHLDNLLKPEARRTTFYDALVLDAKLRQSLVTMRSLGSRGLTIAALEVADVLQQSKHVPAFVSRWCRRAYVAPSYLQQTDAFLDYLLHILDHTGAQVVIPSADGTLEVLRAHRETVARRAQLALAKEEALAVATDKEKTLDIASRLGIGIPRGVSVQHVDEVPEAVRTVGLPAVVKPVESWLWGKGRGVRVISQLVTTHDEAREAVEELTQHGGSTLFQQFLDGRREAISLFYADGTMYARFAQWAKRTQPPLGGTSVYRQSIALPEDITGQAERLVRAIELEGYSEVEFRRDSAGRPYLMEINPRLSASIEVAVRAGVDFPYLLYQWARGEKLERVTSYQTGGWMRFLEGDILTTAQALAQRGRPGVAPPAQSLLDFIAAFFTPAAYDYLDKDDIRPLWTATRDFLHRGVQRVIRGPSSRRNMQ